MKCVKCGEEVDLSEEVVWALHELTKEIGWRVHMHNRVSDEEKPYWLQRVQDAKRLKKLIETLWKIHKQGG